MYVYVIIYIGTYLYIDNERLNIDNVTASDKPSILTPRV